MSTHTYVILSRLSDADINICEKFFFLSTTAFFSRFPPLLQIGFACWLPTVGRVLLLTILLADTFSAESKL